MPDTIINVIMIYHIRYISIYLPAVRLVLGTMNATPFGIAAPREFPMRATFHIWQGGAFTTVLGCLLLPPHRPIHSPTVLHMRHNHDQRPQPRPRRPFPHWDVGAASLTVPRHRSSSGKQGNEWRTGTIHRADGI